MAQSDARIPGRYRDGDWTRVRSPGVREYAHEIRRNVADGRGLVMTGPVGTGKSTAAGLVLTAAIKAQLSCRYWYVPDLVERLVDKQSRAETVRACRAPDLLAWDDFGVGGLHDWVIGLMDQIVENRYARGRPMLVTTNLTREAVKGDPSLQRMTDRWKGWAAVTLSGGSQRGETP